MELLPAIERLVGDEGLEERGAGGVIEEVVIRSGGMGEEVRVRVCTRGRD